MTIESIQESPKSEDLGSCYTNDYEDEDDGDHNDHIDDDEDEDEDNDDDDDDEGYLTYLFDRAFLKQHALAIFVAFLATAITYFHALPLPLSPSSSLSSSSNKSSTATIKTVTKNRIKPLKETEIHHHHSYRRTHNLIFCPNLDYFSPTESHQERIRRILQTDDGEDGSGSGSGSGSGDTSEKWVDPNLQLFQFNFPKRYYDLMGAYYYADDVMDDDNYQKTINVGNANGGTTRSSASASASASTSTDPNFKCLSESMILDEHKKRSTVPMHTVAYIHADIETYYYNENDGDGNANSKNSIAKKNKLLSVLSRNKPSSGGSSTKKKLQPAELSYKGFTAKFVNLATQPLNLYWDGSSKIKPKLVNTIQPFESISTATFPGNSFHISPMYNAEDALQRWTVTYDDSVLYYNPHESLNDEERAELLTPEEKLKYDMHMLNQIYGREYLATTQRPWLSMFPRPMFMDYFKMWDASFFGQKHSVATKQTHFISDAANDGDDGEVLWKSLDYEDYDTMVETNQFVQLPQYREKEQPTLDLTLEVVSASPRVFEIKNFLSPTEVQHMLQLAQRYNVTTSQHKKQLSIYEQEEDKKLTKDEKKRRKKVLHKAQSNAWIRREMTPITNAIYHRVADVLQIDEALLRHRNEHENTGLNTHHSIAEAIHITQYVKGQGYSPRLDGAMPSILNRFQPNRFATIIFFLSDDTSHSDDKGGESNAMEGGELVFPLAVTTQNHDGVTVKPKAGNAVVFYNMLPDGNLDDLSQHTSKLVESGEKWMGTLYVWDPIID